MSGYVFSGAKRGRALLGLCNVLSCAGVGVTAIIRTEPQMNVQGPISDEDVQALVQSALDPEQGFWRHGGSWDVSVTGDANYAAVTVSMHCGLLCGGGETYTYGRSDGRWTYLYISDQWIS